MEREVYIENNNLKKRVNNCPNYELLIEIN